MEFVCFGDSGGEVIPRCASLISAPDGEQWSGSRLVRFTATEAFSSAHGIVTPVRSWRCIKGAITVNLDVA
jgi:hypothetical protein